MKKFFRHITNHPKLIIAVYMVIFLICIFCRQFIQVNYDMNNYLPEDSPSTVALHLLESEYDGGIPNARVMVEDVTVSRALEYKEKLLEIDSVTDVTWLDDAADITVPLETLDKDTVETYYKDNTALFSVTISEGEEIAAVDSIRDIIGNDNAMTGSAVSTAVATTDTEVEVKIIAIISIIIALIILLLTTTSWAEPIIILAGLGVAVVINSGTNLIFGEISFITNAAGSILQLAVSLDYSVFLLHRFEECRQKTTDVKEAMTDALCLSTSSILSSGLTTIIGFLALCLMQFKIGPDLGYALAKGILISLITVFVFMPSFILVTYKIIDKTKHHPFMPSFKGFGKFVTKVMLPAVCIFAVIIVPSFLASNSNSYYYGSSHIFSNETQSGADTEKIEEYFGKSDTYVLMIPKDSTATQEELSNKLNKLPQISSIISYVDSVGAEIPEEYLDSGTLSELNSENYTRMILTVKENYEGEETFELIEKIRDIADSYYPDSFYLAGQGVSTYDLMNTITSDMLKVNLLAIGAVFLVLLITMRSVFVPIILVLSIETAIWVNLSIPYFSGQTVFYISYLIISTVQLGATVDYAILFTDRYKQLRQSYEKKQAIKQTISAVTVSILTSASVLTIVGFLLGLFSTHGILSQLGYFLGVGTLCSLVVILFVLPGLLYIFDRLIIRKNKKHKEVTAK